MLNNNISAAQRSGKHVVANFGILNNSMNNNIYFGDDTFSLSSIDRTFTEWKSLTGEDINSLISDPQLSNPSAGDFRLATGSPAINAGANLGTIYQLALDPSSAWPSAVTTLNQNSFGSGWEIGAYVYPQSGPTPLPGDLNIDHIVNSLDWSYMNSKWFMADTVADINDDGIVNGIDFSALNSNWFKTW
jgi:hypothetical protein